MISASPFHLTPSSRKPSSIKRLFRTRRLPVISPLTEIKFIQYFRNIYDLIRKIKIDIRRKEKKTF